jgi:DNA mismatch endonuclease (patch repair protein)
MSRIRSVDTKPEINVRRALHAMGYRFRLHVTPLPGTPDIVLRKYHAVVEVRGCFWHMHGCPLAHIPKSRTEYWLPKLNRNRERDRRTIRQLRSLGWRVLVVWECEAHDIMRLRRSLREFLRKRA